MEPILKINLTTGEMGKFVIPIEWQKEYLGGASLAARILYDELTKELDPLSPNAPILFLNGPLTGTFGPSTGRFVVCGKSPTTNIWAESNCGGFWGPELRKVGYSGIHITGKAERPVYLLVEDGKLIFGDASELWGLDTYQIQDELKKKLQNDKLKIASIGIAGENLIPSANIMVDHGRAAGRTGLGAVMGAKNLKCIAVHGTGNIVIPNKEEYLLIRKKAAKHLTEDSLTQVFNEMGTAGASDYFDYLGSMPKKYFSKGELADVDKISGATISDTILVGKKSCHGCVIECGREVKLTSKNEPQKGAEYETLVGFGPNLMLTDPEFSTEMGDLCDRYGMDVITVSGTIGYAMKLFEEGRITLEETSGLKLEWGDKKVIKQLVDMIATLSGFGKILAKGTLALEKKYGESGSAVQVNGLELGYHDPRAVSGMALSYATSPRGACHNQSDYFLVDVGQVEEELGMQFLDRQAGAEKAKNVVIHQNWRTLHNSMVMCMFANIGPLMTLELINSALDLDWDMEDMLRCGERGWNIKRLLNKKLGLKKDNDKLPKVLLESLEDGGAQGYVIPLEEMLKAYYLERSWDEFSGMPSGDKKQELNLEWID